MARCSPTVSRSRRARRRDRPPTPNVLSDHQHLGEAIGRHYEPEIEQWRKRCLLRRNVAMTNEVQINRLNGSLGAELRGLNLGSLSSAGLAIINKALIDHHVVAVRDQHLTPAELDAFARMLGAPHG